MLPVKNQKSYNNNMNKKLCNFNKLKVLKKEFLSSYTGSKGVESKQNNRYQSSIGCNGSFFPDYFRIIHEPGILQVEDSGNAKGSQKQNGMNYGLGHITFKHTVKHHQFKTITNKTEQKPQRRKNNLLAHIAWRHQAKNYISDENCKRSYTDTQSLHHITNPS